MQTNILSLSSSEFLKTKIKPGWLKENESIKPPHYSPETFKLYTTWLYFCRIPVHNSNEDEDDKDKHVAEFRDLAAAYVLGEFLLDDQFKNCVIDTMFEKLKRSHEGAFLDAAPDMAAVIYTGTPEGSPARKAVVDVLGYSDDEAQLRKILPQLPNEFHCDLTIAFAAERRAKLLHKMKLRRCDYHQH